MEGWYEIKPMTLTFRFVRNRVYVRRRWRGWPEVTNFEQFGESLMMVARAAIELRNALNSVITKDILVMDTADKMCGVRMAEASNERL